MLGRRHPFTLRVFWSAPRAVLIRGASGSGKSRLAHDLIEAGRRGDIPFARLVADDRTLVEASRPAAGAAGPGSRRLLELRHIGIRQMPFEPLAVVALVVDLGSGRGKAAGTDREFTEIAGNSPAAANRSCRTQAFFR